MVIMVGSLGVQVGKRRSSSSSLSTLLVCIGNSICLAGSETCVKLTDHIRGCERCRYFVNVVGEVIETLSCLSAEAQRNGFGLDPFGPYAKVEELIAGQLP